jgi:hypothetical protein
MMISQPVRCVFGRAETVFSYSSMAGTVLATPPIGKVLIEPINTLILAPRLPYANVVAIKELHHSLPVVPSVPEELSFPKRCFVVLQERAKLAYIEGCGFVGVTLTLPLFSSSLRACITPHKHVLFKRSCNPYTCHHHDEQV